MASVFQPSVHSNSSRARMNPWGTGILKDINGATYQIGVSDPDKWNIKLTSASYGLNAGTVWKPSDVSKYKAILENLYYASGSNTASNQTILNASLPAGTIGQLDRPSTAPSAPPASSPSAQTTVAPVVAPTTEPPEEEKFYQKDWFMPVAIGLGIALIGGTAAFFIARSSGSSSPAAA